MMESAFGIDHGEFSKAEKLKKEPKFSTGRAATATVGGVYHPLIAGKKGKKLRAAGRTYGYGLGGGVAGGLAGGAYGLAASRGNPVGGLAGAAAGGAGGAYGGSYAAFRQNNKRGYYKKESGK